MKVTKSDDLDRPSCFMPRCTHHFPPSRDSASGLFQASFDGLVVGKRTSLFVIPPTLDFNWDFDDLWFGSVPNLEIFHF